MRIGGDTRRRVQGIKEEMEEPLRQLEMYLVRLNEHAGTKRMSVAWSKVETYLLDGHPFMKSDPPTFDMTSSIISTTRRFWSIRHPLEVAT